MTTHSSKSAAIREILFDLMTVSGGFKGTKEQLANTATTVGRKRIDKKTMRVARRVGRAMRGFLQPREFVVTYEDAHHAITEWRSPWHVEEHGWTAAYIGRNGESRWVIEEATAVYVGPGARRHRDDQASDLRRTKAALEFALARTDGRSTEGKRYGKAVAGIDLAIDALLAVGA